MGRGQGGQSQGEDTGVGGGGGMLDGRGEMRYLSSTYQPKGTGRCFTYVIHVHSYSNSGRHLHVTAEALKPQFLLS